MDVLLATITFSLMIVWFLVMGYYVDVFFYLPAIISILVFIFAFKIEKDFRDWVFKKDNNRR